MSRRRKGSTKGQKLKASRLKTIVISILKRNPKKRYNAKQIIKKAKIKNTKDSVDAILENLAQEKLIRHIKDDKYKWQTGSSADGDSGSKRIITGKVDITRIGSAYIVSQDIIDDVFVPEKIYQ